MNKHIEELVISSSKSVSEAIGENNWNSLNQINQTGIITSELCLRTLYPSDTIIDYSAAIMPLMKVLEYELINDFYCPYMKYLKENYTTEQYIEENQLNNRDRKPQDLRRKVIYYVNYENSYRFCQEARRSGTIDFTIGNYRHTVGAESIHLLKCDQTAVKFYKQYAFGEEADDSAVTKWICSLSNGLESLLDLRNNSAHAGKIQTYKDAQTAMDNLVKVDKILFKIITPTLP